MQIEGKEYVLELFFESEEKIRIIGRYYSIEEFEKAVSENMGKELDGEELVAGIGKEPEFPEDEMIDLFNIYDFETITFSKEYWDEVFYDVANFGGGPFWEPSMCKVVCEKGEKLESINNYKFIHTRCGKQPGQCTCSDGWNFDRMLIEEGEELPPASYENEEVSVVCPDCFKNIQECECILIPEELVEIDTLILPSIKKLNDKGYFTAFSCTGHPSSLDGKHHIGASIRMFAQYDYNKPLPEGWIEDKSAFLRYNYSSVNVEEFFEERACVMKSFEKWVDELEPHYERIKYSLNDSEE